MKTIKIFYTVLSIFLFTGCGASYEAVKPNIKPSVQPVAYKKVAYLKDDSAINNDSIVLDMKIVPYGNDYLATKLLADKSIVFDYISPLKTSTFNSGITITEETNTPVNFRLIEKLKLPAYTIGIHTFDLNKKGNFAYISNKNTIKIIKKIPTDSLEHLAKNRNYSKGNNILTIRTKSAVQQVQFQQNSNNLIVLLKNGRVELWNFLKKKKLKTLVSAKNKTMNITVSPNGNYLLISNNKNSKLIRLKNQKDILTITDDLITATFSNNETLLATTDKHGKVSIYDINKHVLKQTFQHHHKGLVYGLVFSPINQETIITAGQDGSIKIWDLLNTTEPLSVKYNTYNHSSNCNRQWIEKQYFSYPSKSLQKFNKKYRPQATECNILGDKKQVINFANKGILSTYMSSLIDTLVNKYTAVKQEWINVDVLDSESGLAKKEIYDWKHSQGMTSVSVNKGTPNEHTENRYIFNQEDYNKFLNTNKKILAYKTQTIQKKTEEYTHLISQMNAGAIYGVIPYGRHLYFYGTGYQKKYSYYQTQTPNVRLGSGIYEYRFDFSKSNQQNIDEIIEKDTFEAAWHTRYNIKTKDAHTILTLKDNLVQFIDYKKNKLVDIISENAETTAIAYDKAHALLAIGLSNGLVKLWDIKKRQPIGQLSGHTSEIAALAFAKNGTVLISGAYDNSAIIWNVKKKTKIKKIADFSVGVDKIKVLKNKDMLIMISHGYENSDVFFYNLKDFKLLKKLSPEIGNINAITSIKDNKKLILGSSGETFNRNKGQILLTINTNTFNSTKMYYNPPFTHIEGLVADEKNNLLYTIGSSSTILRLNLDDFSVYDTIKNMENDKYGWGKILAVGTTEQNTPIVADGNEIISIYK